jgi:hypothetical protein
MGLIELIRVWLVACRIGIGNWSLLIFHYIFIGSKLFVKEGYHVLGCFSLRFINAFCILFQVRIISWNTLPKIHQNLSFAIIRWSFNRWNNNISIYILVLIYHFLSYISPLLIKLAKLVLIFVHTEYFFSISYLDHESFVLYSTDVHL